MSVGDEFESYESFNCKIEEIERDTNCVFVIDNSKTVESANKVIKQGQKQYDAKFRYRYVKLACKRYGTARNSTKCQGQPRPNQS